MTDTTISDQLHVNCSHCGQFVCTMVIGEKEKTSARVLGYLFEIYRISILCVKCHSDKRKIE